jgi:integrase
MQPDHEPASQAPTPVSRDEVRHLVEAGAQLVEVLPREEFDHEHLPGAINLPLKYAYVALCVGTSIRTEEARALRWDAVCLDGDPHAVPPVPPHVQVRRSVRARGDTKTARSRRTLALPQLTITALRAHRDRPDGQRELVFATRDGKQLDAANVRREFRAVVGPVPVTARAGHLDLPGHTARPGHCDGARKTGDWAMAWRR